MTLERVLVVCGAGYVSGKEIMSLQLARGLEAIGHEVSFLTSYWSDGDFKTRLKENGLDFAVLPIGFISATLTWDCIRMTGEQVFRWPGLLIGYSHLLRRIRPARVVHTNWHHLLLLFPFLRPSRDCYWLHEIVPDLPQYRRLFQFLARRLSGFICVSEAVGRSLHPLGVRREQVVVVPNGIADPAMDWYRDHPVKPPRKPGPVRIGIVGQVAEWKGHDDLLEAASLLAREGAEFEIQVFGGGNEGYRRDLEGRVSGLNLGGFVRWHGFVKSQQDIYRDLDVCVVPSRFEEPFGLAALEPAFFEIPVVASNRGGLPEIVVDKQTGILVRAARPDELAASLRELIGDERLRASLGRRARERALQNFGAGRLAGQFSELLGNLGSQVRAGAEAVPGSE